jgi:cytosine/adenosine deaminase-related metal-dependent hydrolase
MILSGTVVADASTVVDDGSVVVEGSRIVAVGPRSDLRDRYPDHEERTYDVLLPGLVGAHVHSVQSLGRGLADDTELLDWLFEYILPMEASLTADQMEIAAKLGYLELIESGTTTVVDHLSVRHADRAFEAAGEMGVRGLLGKVLMDQRSAGGLLESTDEALRESERLVEKYHGAFDDRIRYAVTPRFAVSCSEECLRGARAIADRYDGVRIHTHASENRREIEIVESDTGMRNVEWLHEVGLTGEDVVLAHCVWTDETERDLLAETGTHVVYCPSSNMKLASGVAPVLEYLDRGIDVALGNDGPPCNNTLDPFAEMRQASLLQKVDALDPTATPARAIFEMATVNGAKAAGFDRVGKLKAGWKADVVGLRTDVTRATPLHDVLSHLVFAARGDDVQFTMVDGEVLMDDGEVAVVDADAIRREANEVDLDLQAARETARNVKPSDREAADSS